jgi:DNA-binding transcriptional ArsR family regulator
MPDTVLSPQRLVGLLAEPERRRVVAAMILGDLAVDDIARSADLSVRETVDALARLRDAGLVEAGSDGSFVLIEAHFKASAVAAAPEDVTDHGDAPASDRRVLDVAFNDGKLVRWPTKRSKRLVVLDYLAQSFEPGRRYNEREVNGLLRPFNDDTATTRRYLVDEGLLDRSDGEYWRSGGSV